MKRIVSVLLTVLMLLSIAPMALAADASDPVTLTVFIDHSWYPVEKFTGFIPEEITRLTGVVLDPTIALDDKQLGVILGSGDLPDLIYTSLLIDQISNPELAYSYEELIEKYDTGWIIPPKQLGIARGYAEDNLAYTVLMHYSEKESWEGSQSVPMVGTLIYRKDMWEKLGSPSMTTFDELFDVFTKAKEEFPELTNVLKLNENWNTIVFRDFIGLGQLEFIEQPDGKHIHYSQDAKYKEMLAWLSKCWRAGFLSPDESYFVKGSTVGPAGTWFANSSCTQNGIPGAITDHQKIDPSFVVAEMVPFPDANYAMSDVGWSGVFISKDCADPEAAIRFMEWMFTPEGQALTQMGRPGIDYTLSESGFPVFSAEWKQAIEDKTHNDVYNPWFYFGGSEIVEADSRVATLDPALVADAYAVMREKFDNLPWISAALPKGFSDEKVILDKIQEMVKVYEPKLIMANTDEEFEALYAEFITNAERTGATTLNEYMDSRIAELKPLYE